MRFTEFNLRVIVTPWFNYSSGIAIQPWPTFSDTTISQVMESEEWHVHIIYIQPMKGSQVNCKIFLKSAGLRDYFGWFMLVLWCMKALHRPANSQDLSVRLTQLPPPKLGPLEWEMLEIFAPFSPVSYMLALSQKLPHLQSHTIATLWGWQAWLFTQEVRKLLASPLKKFLSFQFWWSV